MNGFRQTLLLTCIIFSQISTAQFSRFKSKSNFKANEKAADSQNALAAPPNNAPEKNVFGRGTGIKNANAPKQDSQYVTLNPETAFGPEVITSFDFPNTSLMDLTKHMQDLTGINIIIDKDIKGKASITAPTPITVGDAWKAYLTALNLNGYTMVKSGAFYQILNSRDVRYTPTKIYTGTYTPSTDNYVMRIIPLKNIDGTEITRSFRPFLSRYGRIIDIKQTNTIIIHDTGSNINRLLKLITFLDVPGHEESMHIIKVKHTSAQEIAKLLDSILKNTSKGKFARKDGDSGITKIIAEPRTNSIIAMADADGAEKLNRLVNKLDVPILANASGKIHVYYLNYGDSKKLSETLSNLVQAAGTRSTSTSKTRRTSRFTRSSSSTEGLFSAEVKITADEATNSLVVTSSPTDWLTIREVIKKLDIPRDQVFVEGLIMETSVQDGNAFGFSILGATGSGKAQRFGFTGGSNDLVNLITDQVTSLGGLFIGGGVGKDVTLSTPNGDVTVNTVNGLVTAVATDNNTNVIATPQILALDNTEATFEVGETVPFAEQTNAANGSSSFNIKQQKVTLTLKIKPQINKVTRFIKLEIDQKIDDFSGREVTTGGGGAATTTRTAVTQVIVRDRDTIAMGGLMRDKETSSVNKVPGLGDIPVLGWLFKRKSKTREKVNLLFFLTPKIMDSYESTVAETVKDNLNRRSAHLKNAVGENDPFASTMKGLYQKAKKQEQGPLYDIKEGTRYLRENQESAIGDKPLTNTGKDIMEFDLTEDDVPNYQEIAEKAASQKGQSIPQNGQQVVDKEQQLNDLDETDLEMLEESVISEGDLIKDPEGQQEAANEE